MFLGFFPFLRKYVALIDAPTYKIYRLIEPILSLYIGANYMWQLFFNKKLTVLPNDSIEIYARSFSVLSLAAQKRLL